MTKRRAEILTLLASLLAAALIASGCGSSGSSLGSALSYVPKGSPLVITVQTDTSGQQYKQLGSLLSRFPGGSALKSQVTNSLSQGGSVNYNNDVKPLLGNDLVIAAPSVSALRGGQSRFLVALKVNDEGKAASLLKRSATRIGSSHGSDVYRSRTGEAVTLTNGVLVQAPTPQELDQALSRAGGSDHMTESDFQARVVGLPSDALVKVGGDLQALLSQSANGGTARKVAWVNALQTFGLTIAAQNDGLALGFNVRTSGQSLTSNQLPLATGTASPPVVVRAGEIGIGIRGLNQTYTFITDAAKSLNPGSLSQFNSALQTVGSRYGVDFHRDVISQLSGNSSISIGLGNAFAVRTELENPPAFKATLAKLAPALPSIASGAGLKNAAVAKPSGGNPFYALAGSNGKRYVFGVVGSTFVLSNNPAMAGQIAVQSPTSVPGATGAVAIFSDARALVDAIANRTHRSAAAAAFSSALGNLTGWISSSTSGLRGNLKIQVK